MIGDPDQLVDGDPPDLVLPADGFVLDPGDSMTVTFRVQVDNPLDISVTEILNQVTVSSNESNPVKAYVTDDVVAPPSELLAKSAPDVVAYPLTTLAAAVIGSTIIDVVSAVHIEVGDVIVVGGTAATVLAINVNQLTLDTAVTGGIGFPVLPTIKFTLTYTNNEMYDLTNVTVTDALQGGLNFVKADSGGINVPPVTWNLGTVPSQTTGTVNLWARPPGPGTYDNYGTLSSDELSDFYSNTTTTIVGGIELSKLTNDPLVTNTPTGTEAEYVITLTNQLPAPVVDGEVTDTLPAGFTYQGGSTSYSGGALCHTSNRWGPPTHLEWLFHSCK